jgi:hypothetical protein
LHESKEERRKELCHPFSSKKKFTDSNKTTPGFVLCFRILGITECVVGGCWGSSEDGNERDA